MTNTKKKHGNKMKLLSAVGMLTVSAAMLVSSTFAWFSLNKNVTATSMTVTAKSSSVYLLIGDEDATLATIQSANETTKAGKAATITEIYPSAYKDNEVLNYTSQMSASADFGDATKWYRATAAQPTASTAKADTLRMLTTADFDKYVIHYQYKMALATGSEAASNLKVTAYNPSMTNVKTGTNETMQAVKVVVCGPNGYTELSTTDTTGTSDILASTVTDSAVTTIDVYVYYDGNDSSVFTNNIANLEGADFTIEFGVTATSAEPGT